MPAQLLAIDSPRSLDAGPVAACDQGELNFIGVAQSLARDEELFAQGERADCVYKVVSGMVRAVRLLADGRRQITDFYLPGDVFGIELGIEHDASAQALCETVVIAVRRSSLSRDHEQTTHLWRHAMGELQRGRAHILTLGRRSAFERIARFLVDLAARMGGADQLPVPMSRQDIADYLGLTIETVSRTLTQMQAKGLVAFEGCRQVRLLKRGVLAELCE